MGRARAGWIAIGVAALVGGACGGRLSAGSADGGTAGSTLDGSASPDALVCVDVSASSFNTSCKQDSDCANVTTGRLCPGACACTNAAINVSSLPSYNNLTAGLFTGICGCPAEGAPQCHGGTCVSCLGDPNVDPPACSVAADAGADAATCVNIPPSDYSTSCTTVADCMYLLSGLLCDGECVCGSGSTPANTASEAVYQKLTAGITFGQNCACPPGPAPPPLACVSGQCTSQ